MRKLVPVFILLVSALCLAPGRLPASPSTDEHGGAPTDAERARWTMGDMRTLAIALEAFHADHGKYPEGSGLEIVVAAVEPVYVRKAPVRDAWGTALRYLADPEGAGYTIVSAGADRTFDESTWSRETTAASFTEDAVVRTGIFVRNWEYR